VSARKVRLDKCGRTIEYGVVVSGINVLVRLNFSLFLIGDTMVLVGMSDILHAVAGFTRPLIKGEAVLDAGMLVIFGRSDGSDETHKVNS